MATFLWKEAKHNHNHKQIKPRIYCFLFKVTVNSFDCKVSTD